MRSIPTEEVIVRSSQLPCLFCNQPRPKNLGKIPNSNEICHNLYEAGCLNKSGKARDFDQDSIKNLANGKIEEILQETLSKRGFSNFYQYLTHVYSMAGLNGKPTAEDLDFYKKRGVFSYEFLDKDHTTASCNKLITDAEAQISPLKIEKSTEQRKSLLLLHANLQTLANKSYATDIEYYFNEKILDYCRYQDDAQSIKFCKKIPLMKSQAIQLFRQNDNTSLYLKKATAFINEYTVPLYSNYLDATPSDEYQLYRMNGNFLRGLEDICHSVSQFIGSKYGDLYHEAKEHLASDKNTVESLIDFYYTTDRKQRIRQALKVISQQIEEPLQNSFSTQGNTRNLDLRTWDQNIQWIEKPTPDQYTLQPSKMMTLDPYVAEDNSRGVFFDGDLTFFKKFRIGYLPYQGIHKQYYPSLVAIYPHAMLLLDTNPIALFASSAHEIGHAVTGTKPTQIEKAFLQNEYKTVLACYSRDDSIGMRPNQVEEVISDHWMANFIGEQLERVPENERVGALISSIALFCNDIQNKNFKKLRIKGTYSPTQLRINGIIGANLKVRQSLGCIAPSTQYKTCTLSGDSQHYKSQELHNEDDVRIVR